MQVYYGLIHQQLQYCISCWGGVPTTKLQTLVTLQKRSVRSICYADRLAHSEPLFKNLQLLKLPDIYNLQVAKIMHKYTNNSWVGSYNIKSVKSIHSHNTRSSHANFYHPSFSTNLMKQALSISGPRVWSKVPEELKNLNFYLFKKGYKNYLIKRYQ